MSKDFGRELPDDLFNILWHEDPTLEQGKAIVLMTVDEEGRPHPALLSYREVGARDRSTLRVVTHSSSHTTANMRRNGIVTLVFVDERMVYYVKGDAKEIPAARSGTSHHYATMDIAIRHVLQDFVGSDEAGAHITSGITFHSPRRSSREPG